MKIHSRNHSPNTALHNSNGFSLRSLQALQGQIATLGRLSSSSLPPFFVPGRFAVFCISRWA
jgi:hypothetical protein